MPYLNNPGLVAFQHLGFQVVKPGLNSVMLPGFHLVVVPGFDLVVNP